MTAYGIRVLSRNDDVVKKILGGPGQHQPGQAIEEDQHKSKQEQIPPGPHDRPENVDIPDSQNVFIPLNYGEEYIEIPIIISYSLNPDYLPNSV